MTKRVLVQGWFNDEGKIEHIVIGPGTVKREDSLPYTSDDIRAVAKLLESYAEGIDNDSRGVRFLNNDYENLV